MNDAFLVEEFTQPTELRDFFEWHQGIKHYGFWAIEIHNEDCLQIIQQAQQSLADKLHPHYLRQAHITLSAAGLLDDKFFTNIHLQQQVKKIHDAKLKNFSLYLSQIHSFTTSPYLSIEDPSHSLDTIRSLLHSISPGEDASQYIPHTTLGFYKNAYKTAELLKQFSTFACPKKAFLAGDIIFARYNTSEIQGRYEVLHRIPLTPHHNAAE